MTDTLEKPKTRQICFACPMDIFAWLEKKGEAERRNLSNSVVHALQTAKDAEENIGVE